MSLRIPSSLLEFGGNSSAIDTAVLEYPSYKDVPSVAIVESSGMVNEPGQFQVPAESWEEFTEFANEFSLGDVRKVIGGGRKYLGLLEEASTILKESHRAILEEYISTDVPTETQYRKWMSTSVSAKDHSFAPLGRSKLVTSVSVNAYPKASYDELVDAFARIELLPEGNQKQRLIRNSLRKTVMRPELALRRNIELSAEGARRLGSVSRLLLVAPFFGPGLKMATARSYEEFKEGVGESAAAAFGYASGVAGAMAAQWGGAALGTLLGVTPAGWAILATGVLVGIAAGAYWDSDIKEATIEALPDLGNPTLP